MYEVRKLAVISRNQKQCFSGYLRSSNGTKSGNFSGYLRRVKAVILAVICTDRKRQFWRLSAVSRATIWEKTFTKYYYWKRKCHVRYQWRKIVQELILGSKKNVGVSIWNYYCYVEKYAEKWYKTRINSTIVNSWIGEIGKGMAWQTCFETFVFEENS